MDERSDALTQLENETVFEEWSRRGSGSRSVSRAGAVARRLELIGEAGFHLPSVAVVGSKGKGTAATYASATLSAAGMRVVTVTSPSFRSNRERIRVDGRAVDTGTYRALAGAVDAARKSVDISEGYLAPSGWFLLMGLRHALDIGADCVVAEAGRGGMSDEVSLLDSEVVVVTPIFEEHLAELGGSLHAIAQNKLGVCGPSARQLVVGRQDENVAFEVIQETLGRWPELRLARPRVLVSRVTTPLAPELSEFNARLGIEAGEAMLNHLDRPRPSRSRLDRVLGAVANFGRLSVHATDRGQIVIDSAIEARGMAKALGWTVLRHGSPSHVLVSLGVDKDLTGVHAAVQHVDHSFVTLPGSHLTFDTSGWKRTVAFEEIPWPELGDLVLAVGTTSFVGRLADLLDVDLEYSYRTDAD